MYKILLYYKYVKIEAPEQYAAEHQDFCNKLGLKGRIIIASEGINGTCSGIDEKIQQYIEYMHNDSRFSDMEFKIEDIEKHVFKKMHVRCKPELVTFRLKDDANPNEISGKHLKPKEFYDKMNN